MNSPTDSSKRAQIGGSRWSRLLPASPWLWLAIGLLLIAGAMTYDLHRQYRAALSHEEVQLQQLANQVAQNAATRLALGARILDRLDGALRRNLRDAQAIVSAIAALEEDVLALLVIDVDGRVIASSQPPHLGADLSENELLWKARAETEIEPRVYARQPTGALGSRGQMLARARRAPDGNFLGLSAVILGPDYFAAAVDSAARLGARVELFDGYSVPVLAVGDTVGASNHSLVAQQSVQVQLAQMEQTWQVRVSRERDSVFTDWRRSAMFSWFLCLLIAAFGVLAAALAFAGRDDLKRLRHLHQRLLQGADEGLVGIDSQARVRYANPAFARRCGVAPGALLGRELNELLLWPESAESAGVGADPVREVLEGNLVRHSGFCTLADGGESLSATITPSHEGGLVNGALLVFVDPDATEESHPERGALERLYQTLFELSPDGLIIVDLESEKPLAFNAAAYRQLGYSADEFARLRVRDHEANAAPIDSIRHIARALAEGRVEFETRYRMRQGEIRDVLVIAQSMDFSGRPALYWTVRDITERKRATVELRNSESLMRVLIDRLPLPMAVFDGPSVALVNARFAAELGHSANLLKDIDGFLSTACPDPAARVAFSRLWSELSISDNVHAPMDLPLSDAQGQSRVYDMHAARVGERTLLLLVDLSERRLTESRLTEARTLAERANRARSEFLANMSHEIRTPMTAILGLVYLLQKTDMSLVQRDYAQKVDSAARTLLAILDDVLDFAKLEAGRIAIDRKPFALRELLEDIGVIFAASAREKQLAFDIEIDPNAPDALIGDPVRLRQVMLNLVGNALKFTAEGSVKIVVHADEISATHVDLSFSVCDSGIGIDADKIARIFEAFYQGEAATTRRFGGTGLGLPLSSWLIRLMEGRLSVESTPGQGSVFRLFLSFDRFNAIAAPATALEPTDRRLALVIEDDSTAAEVAAAMLAADGWRVQTFVDGESMLAALNAGAPALSEVGLLLVDLELPGIDGTEAVRRACARRGLIRPLVLMLSAHGQEMLSNAAAAAGELIDDALSKPLDQEVLRAAIARAQGARAAQTGALVASSRLADLCVLLVEDNPINRHVAREILISEGARVETAANGRLCLELLARSPDAFDVVLMDIQMPELDGYETTREIRLNREFATLPIIAMSANASAEDRTQSRAVGMNDHLAKPIDVSTLVAAIWRHTRGGELPRIATVAVSVAAPDPNAPPPVLAVDRALSRLAGNRTLYAQMARMFAHEQGESARRLNEALQLGDHSEASRAAHMLKGVAATLGAEALSALAAQLERALRKRVEPGELQSMSDRLSEALAVAIIALESAADELTPIAFTAIALRDFDREAFADGLDALIVALVDSDMAAIDLFAKLREKTPEALLDALRTVEDALTRLDFTDAVRACARLKAALEQLPYPTGGDGE